MSCLNPSRESQPIALDPDAAASARPHDRRCAGAGDGGLAANHSSRHRPAVGGRRAAVGRARRISVDYASWRGAAPRELEPLGLVLKAGAWYLVARPVGKDRVLTYRLASMLALRSSHRTFKRPRGFDLARSWQDSAARFE